MTAIVTKTKDYFAVREIPEFTQPVQSITKTHEDDSFVLNVYHVLDITDTYHSHIVELITTINGIQYVDRASGFSDVFGCYWKSRWLLFARMKDNGQDTDTGLGLLHTRIKSPWYLVPNEYVFNEHDVAINYKTIVVEGEKYTVTFRTAQAPDKKWGANYGYEYQNGGASGPLCSKDCTFSTEEAAIANEVAEVRKQFPSDKKLMQNLWKFAATQVQLSLF